MIDTYDSSIDKIDKHEDQLTKLKPIIKKVEQILGNDNINQKEAINELFNKELNENFKKCLYDIIDNKYDFKLDLSTDEIKFLKLGAKLLFPQGKINFQVINFEDNISSPESAIQLTNIISGLKFKLGMEGGQDPERIGIGNKIKDLNENWQKYKDDPLQLVDTYNYILQDCSPHQIQLISESITRLGIDNRFCNLAFRNHIKNTQKYISQDVKSGLNNLYSNFDLYKDHLNINVDNKNEFINRLKDNFVLIGLYGGNKEINLSLDKSHTITSNIDISNIGIQFNQALDNIKQHSEKINNFSTTNLYKEQLGSGSQDSSNITNITKYIHDVYNYQKDYIPDNDKSIITALNKYAHEEIKFS